MYGEVMVNYWLMKSELDVYPWSQLVEDRTTHWDGVRNYQARNIMRDDMKNGDWVLFYHSIQASLCLRVLFHLGKPLIGHGPPHC